MVRKKIKAQTRSTKNIGKIVILAGVLILAAVILVFKNLPEKTVEAVEVSTLSPEAQLDAYLEEGKPIFAFFHSNNCYSCIVMMEVVEEVHPEFADSVMLVDVNVYDEMNQSLLQRAQIYSIPTQVFIDKAGQGKVIVGGMSNDELRAELQLISEGAK
jgi:thiol:disulfide interchange protein